MFVLCLCYTISSIPHTYYGYWAAQYDKASDQIFRISLGIFWLQYAFNVWIYAAQRDQYWNAYKDYIFENLIPGNKDRSNEMEENNNNNKLDSSTSNDNNDFRVDNQLPYRWRDIKNAGLILPIIIYTHSCNQFSVINLRYEFRVINPFLSKMCVSFIWRMIIYLTIYRYHINT